MVHHFQMIPTQRLPVSLTPLDAALAALLRGIEPVAPVRASARGSPGLRRGGYAAASRASLPRRRRQRWLGVARPRSRRRLVLFAAAAGGAAGLGRGRRSHAGGLRLRDRCRPVDQTGPMVQVLAEATPGQGVRRAGSEIAEASIGDRFRAAHSPARSLDRARGGPCRTARAPSAAAHRQYSRDLRRCGDGAADRGKRAARPAPMSSAPRPRDAMRHPIAEALDDRRLRYARHHRRQRRRPQRCGDRGPGQARRGHRPWHRAAARPDRGGRQDRKDSRHRAAGRAGSGARGVVDAGASGAGSPVRAVAAAAGHPAAGAQDRLQRRHHRNRAAATRSRARWLPLAVGELLARCDRPRRRLAGGARRQPRALLRARRSMPICCGTDMEFRHDQRAFAERPRQRAIRTSS